MKSQNLYFNSIAIILLFACAGQSYCQENVQGTLGFFAPTEVKSDSLELLMQDIENSEAPSLVKSISIYGAGGLFGAITGDSGEDEANGGLAGSVGVNIATNNILCNVFFSYNGKKTVEMNRLSDLGNSLLNPNTDGQSISASVLWKPKKENQSGVSVKALVADNLWQLDSTTVLDASPFSLKVGLFAVPFTFPKLPNDNIINLIVDGHLTYRSVMGDFNNSSREIGSTMIIPRGYWGFEIGASMQLNSISFFVQYSNNAKLDNVELPGFTGQQIVLGLSVTGDLIKWL